MSLLDLQPKPLNPDFLMNMGFQERLDGKEFVKFFYDIVGNTYRNFHIRYRFRNKFRKPGHHCILLFVTIRDLRASLSTTHEIQYTGVKTIEDFLCYLEKIKKDWKISNI